MKKLYKYVYKQADGAWRETNLHYENEEKFRNHHPKVIWFFKFRASMVEG